MEKKIKVKKLIWWVLSIIGILPFVITLSVGVYHSIVGAHDGICIMCDRPLVYGFEAFYVVMVFAIWMLWPVYIIALIVIILTIIRLLMLRRKVNNSNVK